ncbi:MAG: PKD domain-containing protein [Chitinophagaceae bacterium]
MKKLSAFLIFFIGLNCSLYAAHIVGGEMIYEYLGPGTAPNSKQYRITLRLFRDNDCTQCAQMPTNVFIGIFTNDNNTQFPGAGQYFDVPKGSERSVLVADLPPCINNAPDLDYSAAEYSFKVDLPDNKFGYTAAYQTCCRINGMVNVFNSSGGGGGGGGTGSTYTAIIPGTNQVPVGQNNSSPVFNLGISVICQNKAFTLNFNATDPDGDQLVYSFCDAYNGGAAQGANNINPAPPISSSPPQYSSVPYINGFSGSAPLGSNAIINSSTGEIKGTAPGIGEYVVSVCIDEYRNGKLIGYHRKDFIVNVDDCDFAGAELLPSYSSCDGFTMNFTNLNNSPLNQTFFWDFGDGTTSTDPNPTHTYADTGVYKLTLEVNRGQPCGGSAKSVVRVFPGFFPGFSFSGICVNKPTQFTDTTRTVYGTVDSWRWNFGNNNSSGDTSRLRNPTYTYTELGDKTVQFIVTNSKGCIDTVIKDVPIIVKPPLSVGFKDTLICKGDAVQLEAIGNGLFSWLPNTEITGGNTATPTVTPSVTRTYKVQLNDNGCINEDSVRVRVVNFVTLRARNDTTICSGDAVQLSAVSDGFRFQWAPLSDLSNPNVINPIAKPASTTTYKLTATLGGCTATDDVVVTTIPYPAVNAGMDTSVCFGTSAQLNATIKGSSFVWSPASTLNNPNVLNPIALPTATTEYVLTARDIIGCPKPGRDTVVVTVLPEIKAFAGRDTAVIIGQALQFQASGGTEYLWSPATSLSNANIPDPVAVYDATTENILYRVIVGDDNGCIDSAFVNVRVFKTDPSIFVPTAFTPNGDGKNDFLRPIAVGIAEIEYFRVYNRWGQLVFSTTTNGQGWDGKIGGKEQNTATFVWLVKGVDIAGKTIFLKGTSVLIR